MDTDTVKHFTEFVESVQESLDEKTAAEVKKLLTIGGAFDYSSTRTVNPWDYWDAIVDAAYYCLDSIVRCGENIDAYPNLKPYLECVRSFTEGAFGSDFKRSNIDDVFPLRMAFICSEILEIRAANVRTDGELNECIDAIISPTALKKEKYAYLKYLNHIAQHGVFKAIFDEVHAANMRKADQPDGTRQFKTKMIDGDPTKLKVIKPEGWVGPNVERAFATFTPPLAPLTDLGH